MEPFKPHRCLARGDGRTRLGPALGWCFTALALAQAQAVLSPQASQFRVTNGPCVFECSLQLHTNIVPRGRVYRPPPTNLPPDLRRTMSYFLVANQTGVQIERQTNSVFSHFLPESLNHLAWTNLIAHTNGRSTAIWSARSRPPGWPDKAPEATWNRASLLWGMEGMTALSPGWEGESAPGQIPVTALTRRHGYTRGHHMGPDGFGTRFAGKKVWFLTKEDQVVERTVVREVVRTIPANPNDYTLLLFNKDLPQGIQPVAVAHQTNFYGQDRVRFKLVYGAPPAVFKAEQTGHVSADIPGLTMPTWKGGDSGSANLLPLPGKLVFISGRSTSGASEAMQADMDELCRLQGLNPTRYRLQWVDLSCFPEY